MYDVGKTYPSLCPLVLLIQGMALFKTIFMIMVCYMYTKTTIIFQEFVCGEHCGQCMPGYYNLDEANPDGCQPCFCFGLSYECQSLTWGRTQASKML